MRLLLAVLLGTALVGCVSAPPLEPGERFQISCRRSTEKADECIVRVKALFTPPPPIGHYLFAEVTLDEGKVVLEIKGTGHQLFPGQEEGVVEAKVGFKPGVPFTFVLSDRGHRDEYEIVVPAAGDPKIEPSSREFSERG